MGTVIDRPQAHNLIDQLPQGATWEDLMYEIYVRESVDKGLNDIENSKYKAISDIRNKYAL